MTGLRSNRGLHRASGDQAVGSVGFACLTHEVWPRPEDQVVPARGRLLRGGPPRGDWSRFSFISCLSDPVKALREPWIITWQHFLAKLIWFWTAGSQVLGWMNRSVFPSLKILSSPFKCSLAAGEECWSSSKCQLRPIITRPACWDSGVDWVEACAPVKWRTGYHQWRGLFITASSPACCPAEPRVVLLLSSRGFRLKSQDLWGAWWISVTKLFPCLALTLSSRQMMSFHLPASPRSRWQ